jgi:ABC-type multidrug transport system permease subunit
MNNNIKDEKKPRISKAIEIFSILVGIFLYVLYFLQNSFIGVSVCGGSDQNLLLTIQIFSGLFILIGIVSLLSKNRRLNLFINWLFLILIIIFIILFFIFNKINEKKYLLCKEENPLIIMPITNTTQYSNNPWTKMK